MNLKYPLLTIASPVRNREAYLPYYLEAIYNQTFPKENITLLFVLNNSIDNSENILFDFKKKYKDEYHKIRIEKYNREGIPNDDVRSQNCRINYIHEHLSKIRNYILNRIKTEWLFSVDTDIMIKPDTINTLLNHNKKCISALICNGYVYAENNSTEGKKINPYKYTNIMEKDCLGRYVHVKQKYWDGVIRVNMTGAVYLLHKDIYKSCKYKNNIKGEDIGFCEDVEEKRFKIYCDTNHKLPHCMNENLLEKYKKGEFIF